MKSFLLTAVFVVASCSLAQAQPSSGGPAPTSSTAVPIDGGASLLLVSGAAYALRKLRQRRRK